MSLSQCEYPPLNHNRNTILHAISFFILFKMSVRHIEIINCLFDDKTQEFQTKIILGSYWTQGSSLTHKMSYKIHYSNIRPFWNCQNKANPSNPLLGSFIELMYLPILENQKFWEGNPQHNAPCIFRSFFLKRTCTVCIEYMWLWMEILLIQQHLLQSQPIKLAAILLWAHK